ncbi:MAG: methyl-accepting chemotaxis protein [Chloracidobacterium sp.]|nr:methyl-accepting chemotaxis protein [Chloracidobacterium sp.]
MNNLFAPLLEPVNALGIDVPLFIVIVSGIMILVTIFQIVRLWFQARGQLRSLSAVVSRIDVLLRKNREGRKQKEGVTQDEVDNLRGIFDASKSELLQDAWIDYEAQLVQKGNNGLHWASTPADNIFTDANIVSINRDWYASYPGVVTGLGLLFTFLAILVALLNVSVVDGQVKGVDLLIRGLSGKFVSSVVALACATIFVVFEKNKFHALDGTRSKLVSILDRRIPQFSATQVLVDIADSLSRLNADTSNGFVALKDELGKMGKNVENLNTSVQDLGTSLVPILVQGVGESVNPTINRMVETIEELNKFLRLAEETRNNQLNESLSGLLSQLKEDLSRVFGEMSRSFRESLTGSTHGQFENVTQTLGETANLLGSMNSQFELSQNSLQNVMREVSDTMQQLMTGLSLQVEHLGQQMSDTVKENSQSAVNAARDVVSQANQLTAANEQRLEQLLTTHDTQLTRVEQTSSTLESVIAEFNRLMTGLRQTSETSAASVTGITTAATLIGEAATKAAAVHQQLQLISDHVKESNEHQEMVWRGISENLGNYQNLFKQTEGSATKLLDQIGINLTNYQEVTQNGFNNLVQAADQHFTNAVQKLGGTVNELGDVLEDLTEQLEKIKSNGNRQ